MPVQTKPLVKTESSSFDEGRISWEAGQVWEYDIKITNDTSQYGNKVIVLGEREIDGVPGYVISDQSTVDGMPFDSNIRFVSLYGEIFEPADGDMIIKGVLWSLPLQIGKTYDVKPPLNVTVTVSSIEQLNIPAGSFQVYKIVYDSNQLRTKWYSPELKNDVKFKDRFIEGNLIKFEKLKPLDSIESTYDFLDSIIDNKDAKRFTAINSLQRLAMLDFDKQRAISLLTKLSQDDDVLGNMAKEVLGLINEI